MTKTFDVTASILSKKKQNMVSEEKKDANYSWFKQVSEAQKQQILLDRNCKSTQQKMQQAVKLFNQFLLETGSEKILE